MAPIHLIVLNLVYDLSCIALPFDNVDEDFLKHPHTVGSQVYYSFMVWMGPISSAFDILTFILLYFVIVPMATGQLMFMEQRLPVGLLSCSRQVGSLNPCGPKPWLSICFVQQNFLSYKVVHHGLFLEQPWLATSFVTFLPYSSIASLLHLTPLETNLFPLFAFLLFCIW